MVIVIDTSVIFKWLVTEEPQEEMAAARLLRKQYLQGEKVCISSDLLLYELGNALATRREYTQEFVAQRWNRFLSFRIQTTPHSGENIQAAIELAKQYNITVYDASYVVLAKEKGCDFITADSKLVAKLNLPFVKHILSVK